MKYQAGSYESSDCLITVSDANETKILIESIVFDQFGDEILRVIEDTLKKHNISNVLVECKDKGALEYTVIARLETALQRGGYYE